MTVGPKHPPELIRRVLRRADFKRCWTDPAASAPAAYHFTIGPGGAVTSAEARDAHGEVSREAPHQCAVEVLRGLTFPSDMAGLTVTYPLR